MIEVRIHGRGGQGGVTSAELLALAAINEGKYAQAFPTFGPERRGAPVIAFCRIDDKKIRIRSAIYTPDVVVVLDPGILRLVDVTSGLKEDGILCANSKYSGEELREEIGLPITNTAMLGSILKARNIVPFNSLIGPLKKRFGRIAEKNIKVFTRAYEETQITK